MPPKFVLSPQQARAQKRDLVQKDQIVAQADRAMKAVLQKAVEDVYAHYARTGRYKEPDLSGMTKVARGFYKSVVMAALRSSNEQSHKERKRLAKGPVAELPQGVDALRRMLRDKKYWRKIYARADKLVGRQKKEYLDKLKKQFKKILPTFNAFEDAGDALSPKKAKQMIAEAWQAPRARVETIFRTEATNYFAKAQVAYFDDSPYIIGFLFDSVRDTSRTPICKSRHGLIYRPKTKTLDDNTPPCHYNCRSHLIPLVNDAENRKMLEDPRRDPDQVKVVPLPAGWRN